MERRRMLDEQPRLFFIHFWANDDALKLAKGVRAALDKTATAESVGAGAALERRKHCTGTPCQELADGGPQSLARGSKSKGHPEWVSACEPEERRNGTSEIAARRHHGIAMERREGPAFFQRGRSPCLGWRGLRF